jgi:hypothetical protein
MYQSEHLSYKFVMVRRRQRWACCTASTIAVLAAGLTSVAVPLVCHLRRGRCRCFAIGFIGDGLDLLLDGCATAGPPAYDDSLMFFASAHAELLG